MTVTVAGYTTADIHDAALLAGEGGEVYFPAGDYESHDLEVAVAGQHWRLHPKAEVIRSVNASTSLVTVNADWKTSGGTWNGNRAENASGAGVYSNGFAVTMEDCDINDVHSWGVHIKDAPFTMRRFNIRRTGQAGILWHIVNGPSRGGPQIEYGNVSRSNPADYIASGGIHVKSEDPDEWVQGTRILYNRIRLPQGSSYSAVAAEMIRCELSMIGFNDIMGGRIGASLGKCKTCVVTNNPIKFCSSYHVEVAGGSLQTYVGGNPIEGFGSTGTGVENSGASHGTRIIGNPITGVAIPVRITPDSSGVIQFN